MPRSPSLVPEDAHRDVYLVLDDSLSAGYGARRTKRGLTARG
jgi:hypothetical protein